MPPHFVLDAGEYPDRLSGIEPKVPIAPNRYHAVMTDPISATDSPDVAMDEPLTHDEDAELRRLNYMAETGQLSARLWERFVWLRLRDRRQHIREPREFQQDQSEVR